MAYNRKPTSHKKELYYLICIVAVVSILLFSFLGPHGYRELRKLRLEEQELRKDVDDLKRSNEDRGKNIKALKSDKEALEGYARKKGYGRENEIIQHVPSQPANKPK
jgi:cell division protein FtsB